MKTLSASEFVARKLTALAPPARLLFGDEPQLLEEARAHIRADFSAGNVYRAELESLDKSAFAETGGGGLFGEQSADLFEIVGQGGPSPAAVAALLAFLPKVKQPDIALCVIYDLKREHLKKSWLKSVGENAVCVRANRLSAADAEFWLNRWAATAQVALDDDARALLAAQTEGNLTAAKQTIFKLSLTGDKGDSSAVRAALADGAQYDVFDLTDAILNGRGSRAVNVLRRLISAGVAAPLIIWSLADIINNVLTLQDGGAAAKIWGKRGEQLRQLADNIGAPAMGSLLRQAASADRLCKGAAIGDVETALTRLVVNLAARQRGVKIRLPDCQP